VPLPGFRVLVADDNKDAADSLQRILGLYGYAVRVAYDGASALEVGGTFGPQVAVLDIGMPGADGYEVARAMRERYGKNITLVALTGWGQDNDRKRSIDAGFDYHLTKPVDPSLLNDLLVEIAAIAERKAS
jgi:CheY-like chemotaxis protein